MMKQKGGETSMAKKCMFLDCPECVGTKIGLEITDVAGAKEYRLDGKCDKCDLHVVVMTAEGQSPI